MVRIGGKGMKLLKTIKWYLLIKLSLMAGIDDFSCGEEWRSDKSLWWNARHIADSEEVKR